MGKVKKEQKQKIKLKIGRTLTKDDNVTNTTFKAKKIVLLNQTKQYVGDPENKTKFLVIDSLKCISSNSNPQAKVEALKKLFSFVSEDRLLPELQNILDKLVKLMFDTNASVRKQAHSTIRHILQTILNAGQSLHLPALTAHLSRAITDVHQGVCTDSLKFVDLFLENFPDCICNSHSLLEDLLHLISRDSMVKGKYRSHLLVFSPSEDISSLKWRNSVLTCTLSFIRANVVNLKPKKSVSCSVDLPMWERNTPCVVIRHKKFDPMVTSLNELSWFDSVESQSSEVNFTLDAKHFNAYINKLVPTLCDIFIEVEPGSSHIEEVFAIKNRLNTAVVIVDIICRISEWINYTNHEEILQKTLLDNINKMHQQFFQHFPYSHSSTDPLVEDLISRLDIALCEIFCISMTYLSFPETLAKKVMNVLCDKIKYLDNSEKEDSILILVNLLKILLHKSNENMAVLCEPHVNGFLQYLHSLPASSPCKPIIWNFFKDLALDIGNFGSVFPNAALKNWFPLFVKQFIQASLTTIVEPIDEGICTDILKIAGRFYPAFFQVLLENAESIISLLMSSNEAVSGTAATLIFKFPIISRKHFSHIATALRSNCVSSFNVVKLLNRLTRILQEDTECTVFSTKVYVYFLLNVIVGPHSSVEDYEIDYARNEEGMEKAEAVPFNLSLFTIVPCKESMSEDIVNQCFNQLSKMRNRSELLEYVQQYMLQVLEKLHGVSTFSAASLLMLHKTFMPVGCIVEIPEKLSYEFANFAVACILNDLADTSSSLNALDFLMQCNVDVGHIFSIIADNFHDVKSEHLKCMRVLVTHLLSLPTLKREDDEKIVQFLTLLKQVFLDPNKENWCSKICMTYLGNGNN